MKHKKQLMLCIVCIFLLSGCGGQETAPATIGEVEIDLEDYKTGDELIDQTIDDAVEIVDDALEGAEIQNSVTTGTKNKEVNQVYQLNEMLDMLDSMSAYLNEGTQQVEDESLQYEYDFSVISVDIQSMLAQFEYQGEQFFEETVDVPDFNMSTTTSLRKEDEHILYELTAITLEDDDYSSAGDLISRTFIEYDPAKNLLIHQSEVGEMMATNDQVYLAPNGDLFLTKVQSGWGSLYQAVFYNRQMLQAYTIDATEDSEFGIDFTQSLPSSFEDMQKALAYAVLFSYDGKDVSAEINR